MRQASGLHQATVGRDAATHVREPAGLSIGVLLAVRER